MLRSGHNSTGLKQEEDLGSRAEDIPELLAHLPGMHEAPVWHKPAGLHSL